MRAMLAERLLGIIASAGCEWSIGHKLCRFSLTSFGDFDNMLRGNIGKFLLAALLTGLILLPANGIDLAAASMKGDSGMKREIVLAGGCFWGVQEYFSRLPGVLGTTAGYAQSKVKNPSYKEVCSGTTGAAEAVKIVYDPARVSLAAILAHFFHIIDPLAVNRQGNDMGTQYRTGIYFTTPGEAAIAKKMMAAEQAKQARPLAVELASLQNFWPAEEYHQGYLKKNPGGYCHISFAGLGDPEIAAAPAADILQKELDPEAWRVTQKNGTEAPFSGKYNDFAEPGIYVDVVSGEPLFSSSDKFASGCGWPAFAAPIAPQTVLEKPDSSHGMERVEVRSATANSHLGHVFDDGPAERGGRRYCINSAALRFVPLGDMEKEGYGAYVGEVERRHGK